MREKAISSHGQLFELERHFCNSVVIGKYENITLILNPYLYNFHTEKKIKTKILCHFIPNVVKLEVEVAILKVDCIWLYFLL